MAEWNNAQVVEQLAYELKLADFPRGQNRARINQLFNGWPPYSAEEEQENNIQINVNDLSGTRLAHDARSQLYSAFLKPGKYFSLTTDAGPPHKRQEYSAIATTELNKIMKRSIDYFECYRSKFASDVLHGIGPAAWESEEALLPDPIGVEDVLIPGKTLLTMKNLPLFMIYRSFTAPELIKLTRGPQVDPGWQMDVVDAVLEWVDRETMELYGSTWPEVWSPEKMQERVKGDGGFYPGDTVPTIDCFDGYFWKDDGKESGWVRRIILDSWGTPALVGGNLTMQRRRGKKPLGNGKDLYDVTKGQFLYTSGQRYFAQRREHIISFQFADLSAVAPFQYHSVRSLGFLVYALCHLQNRMRCKFNEAVFEALMMYFKVKTMDDAQRALKLDLINRGFIDDTLTPLTAQERYQVNTALVELGINSNSALIEQHASSFTQNSNFSKDRVEKTRYQVMAEVNAMTSLISAGLMQAYQYQEFEDREIVRRAFRPNTKDLGAQLFQSRLKTADFPEKLMCADAWDTQHERVLGAGNQTLEMGIAEWLMTNREKFDPDPQREILRKATFAVTGDPGFSNLLVPEEPVVSKSIHDAQSASATLLMGLPMALVQGINHQEYAQALLATMASEISKITQRNNVATPEELTGLQNLAGQTITGQPIKGNGIADHIGVLATNKDDQATVKELSDQLGKLMNLVKAFAQRLQKQQQAAAQKQQQGNGGLDPKDAAKIAATQAQAQIKQQNTRESHAQRTAQRQIQFEQDMQQRAQEHQFDLQKMQAEAALEIQSRRLKSLEEE